jgi:hypothetical protein
MTEPKQRWQKLVDESWTERVPAPVEMSDTEILDFLSEYLIGLTRPGRFVLDLEGVDTIRAGTLRDVVKLAKAKFDEEQS